MKFPKFILREDWYSETEILGVKSNQLVFEKGKVFESNSDGKYHIEYGGWSEDKQNVGGRMILSVEEMRKAKNGDKILFTEELNFEIKELTEEEELEVKKYRIQLDVTTNRKKLREIENFMRKTLEEMI